MDRMNAPGTPGGQSLLNQVEEGMDVVDRGGKKVGQVDVIYLGDPDLEGADPGITKETAEPAATHPSGYVAEGMTPGSGPDRYFPGKELPDPVQRRLMRTGFLRISGHGLLPELAYATPDQIRAVSKDEVHLNVDKDGLIRRE